MEVFSMSDLASVYDAVLFDMDGVLLTGRSTAAAIYQRAANDVVRYLGADPLPEQLARLEQRSYGPLVEAACHDAGIDPERFWELRERCASAREHRWLARGLREPHADTDALFDLSVPLAVVSNNRHDTVQFVLDTVIPGVFEVGRGRDPSVAGYRRRKPDSAYLDETLDALGVETALYVGDRTTDVEAAHAAGIDAALLTRPEAPSINMTTVAPTYRIESLTELRTLSPRQVTRA